jgi:hypothetical protein
MQKQQIQKQAIAKSTFDPIIQTRPFAVQKTASEVQPRLGYNIINQPLYPSVFTKISSIESQALVQRKIKISSLPSTLFSDWRESISSRRPDKVKSALENYVFTNTKHSDQEERTFDDEVGYVLDLQADHLLDQSHASKLLQYQKVVEGNFANFRKRLNLDDFDSAIEYLNEAARFINFIYDLGLQEAQYDVTWKKQVRPGEIYVRATPTRVEAIFEVDKAPKNLNVSLRRHWWTAITDQSQAENSNSIMSPQLTEDNIKNDMQEVAQEYKKYVSKNGESGEFGVDVPSGQHYHVNRLNRQQPHCFPNRGSKTVALNRPEYLAAAHLKVYQEHEERGKRHLAGWTLNDLKQAAQAAPGTFDKLRIIRVPCDKDFWKSLLS